MATIYSQVKLATVTNVDLSISLQPGVSKIDDVLVVAGDRILVKAQTLKSQNGIYTINALGVWSRTSDFALASIQDPGGIVFVTQGSVFADTGWIIASDTPITVGSTVIEFEKITVNLKIQGADLPSNIVLRSEKGYPLTINELDNNFKYLSVSLTQKLNIIDFNPISIRDKINTLSAAEAGLNAFRLQDSLPDITPSANSIAKRTPSGNINANRFFGDLTGLATNAELANFATLAANVTGVVAVINGGTGANTAEMARNNLNTINKSGDTLTGKLTFAAATTTLGSSFRILPRTSPQAIIENGDVWTDNEFIYYQLNNIQQKIARVDSPEFTGTPNAPTQSTGANNASIATTQFVKNVKTELIDPVLNSKAPIDSPLLIGNPRSVTPATNNYSSSIATTEFSVNYFNFRIANYSTTTQVNNIISNYLLNYYTKTQSDSNLSSALQNYYTKTQIDTIFQNYYTKTQSDSNLANGLSIKANTTYVDGLQDKWGSSRKFVQSTMPTGAVNGDFWFKI